MSVLRRDLKQHLRAGSDLFEKVLVFHNTKYNTVLAAIGFNADHNAIFCVRSNFDATHVFLNDFHDLAEDTFWALLALDDVIEIEPTAWQGLQNAFK